MSTASPITPDVTSQSFVVIDGPRKGWRWTDAEGVTHDGTDYPDLRDVRDRDPRNVRRTFDFHTAPAGVLPERVGPWAKELSAAMAQLQAQGVEPSTATFTLRDGHVARVS